MTIKTTDAENLQHRLPLVRGVLEWFQPMTFAVASLDVASQLLFSRITKVTWRTMSTRFSENNTQPVGEQIELGRLVAVLRFWYIFYARFYTSASGGVRLSLTQGASDALLVLEQYDPLFQSAPVFDVDETLLRVFDGTRVA